MDEIAGNGMAIFAMALGGNSLFQWSTRKFVSVDLLLCLECLAAGDEIAGLVLMRLGPRGQSRGAIRFGKLG